MKPFAFAVFISTAVVFSHAETTANTSVTDCRPPLLERKALLQTSRRAFRPIGPFTTHSG
jgi:hypothetical protein